ncbi:hypothetical protein IW261DRAFT_1596200 [Armillaria novae-zelandiae]|uniref:Uncharacterized protein n=1 Tax=Armillaria novae-zelandiae TaxID=153914 RepID=A0AA39NXR2_9AGAR|nr:hypothetical protein IW261DRAFT_1596200 [Armillaria novae-zelandiae]
MYPHLGLASQLQPTWICILKLAQSIINRSRMMFKEGEIWKSSKVVEDVRCQCDLRCYLSDHLSPSRWTSGALYIMAGLADIPSDLTDDYKALVFQYLDANLNSIILCALLHAMNIFTVASELKLNGTVINQCWQIRRALVGVVILLYSLTTIDFAVNWGWVHFVFIQNGKSLWTAFVEIDYRTQATWLIGAIVSSMSTIITDLYIIWCCWMVWGQCWVTVLLPILFLIAATGPVMFITLYISFVLATTIWCTLFIIYRILTVTGFKHGAAIATITRGVAPTLLIGRAAAGHTRPNDEDDDSTASSEASTTSYQEPTIESSVYEVDIEAQQEQGEELIEVVERTE